MHLFVLDHSQQVNSLIRNRPYWFIDSATLAHHYPPPDTQQTGDCQMDVKCDNEEEIQPQDQHEQLLSDSSCLRTQRVCWSFDCQPETHSRLLVKVSVVAELMLAAKHGDAAPCVYLRWSLLFIMLMFHHQILISGKALITLIDHFNRYNFLVQDLPSPFWPLELHGIEDW